MNKELEKNMNKFLKKSSIAIALGTLFLSQTVFAQQVPQGQKQTPQSLITIPTNQQVPMDVVNNTTQSSTSGVGQGNSFEQQTTPLLRELARKKSILELDKLNLEIAKVEKDTLKEKNESSNPQNPANVNMANPSPTVPFYGSNNYSPNVNNNMQQPMGLPNYLGSNSNTIKVYMTYGKINNLYAKIGYGEEGGYSVKAGDILPDGRRVILVKPEYIEISKNVENSKKEKGIEKIFVTAPSVPKKDNQQVVNPAGGTASSTSIGPLKMPVYNTTHSGGGNPAQAIPFMGFNSPQ